MPVAQGTPDPTSIPSAVLLWSHRALLSPHKRAVLGHSWVASPPNLKDKSLLPLSINLLMIRALHLAAFKGTARHAITNKGYASSLSVS